MESDNRKPNHLINEKSSYLLQHAYNPIDWYPWGEEAFAKAKAEDKPIFFLVDTQPVTDDKLINNAKKVTIIQ